MKSVRKLFRTFLKRGAKISDLLAYVTGKYRYKIYYSKKFGFLMRRHIREQIDFRIEMMNRDCYNNGECIQCGCETPALQMANRPCDGICYPKMMDSFWWKIFGKTIIRTGRENKTAYKEIVFDINKYA